MHGGGPLRATRTLSSRTWILMLIAGAPTACATGAPSPAVDETGGLTVAPLDAGPAPPADTYEPFPTFDSDSPDFGPREDTTAPDVEPAAMPAQLTLGHAHSCARLVDGTVRCWGSNAAGELGDGTQKSRGWAMPVRGLSGIAEVNAPSGARRTCARAVDGTLKCWGSLAELDLPERCRFGDPPDWFPCTTSPMVLDAPPGVVELAQGLAI